MLNLEEILASIAEFLLRDFPVIGLKFSKIFHQIAPSLSPEANGRDNKVLQIN